MRPFINTPNDTDTRSGTGASVEVQNLHVTFPLYHGSARTLRKTLAKATTGRFERDQQQRMVVQALRGISLSLKPGDRLGLVGGNGAGKTTLLRSLAGIYEPVAGRVVIRGEINALLDTNLGMNVDLTGRENITLRGLHAGMSPRRIRAIETDVQDFADLGSFLDMPVRTYSSGMVVRLGFALATSIRPRVLLMDEWFLAGDTNFMLKAQGRLEQLVQQAEILVISTHQLDVVSAWCTRVLWMDQGSIKLEGPPEVVIPAYLSHEASMSEAATAAELT
ncbi:ABC transporter ATP-binding protein [Lichenicola cladoniae]|uniref:ABC transporter ATP-binding protein n=1 Tax=Lichenicola cladoniae TaxID=1484109 RepID=A0A6M8HPW3_9PROT|nr:ABC transporter ATP-binding protein [Lichenicola cladoniae]NPD66381.1 ABC transporter ATP-binding protein [Acetobacteraceae bacterium]QKE90378.1 ABC transporter ATP-binding protein [Lichenicola cladoniae]